MIKTLAINSVKSYVGFNVVHLDRCALLSVILGPNGSGKSTFLLAISYATGASDIPDLPTDSFVAILLEDDTRLYRSPQTCMVNGEECDTQSYRQHAAAKLRPFTIDTEIDWRDVLSNPLELLNYMQSVWEKYGLDGNDGAAYRMEMVRAYSLATSDREKWGDLVVRSRARASAINSVLKAIEGARSIQSRALGARKASRSYKDKAAIYWAGQCRLKVTCDVLELQHLSAVMQQLKLNWQETQRLLAVTRGNLQTLNLDRVDFTKSKVVSTEQLASLTEEQSRLQIDRSTFDICVGDITSMKKRALLLRQTLLESWIQVLEESGDGQREISVQREYLRSMQALLGAADECLTRIVQELTARQVGLAQIEQTRNSLQTQSTEIETQLRGCRSKLKDAKSMLMARPPALERDAEILGTASDSTIAALQETYPLILGDVIKFIRPKDAGASHILRKALKMLAGIVVVVESDATAMEYARSLHTYGSKPVFFLPRTLKSGKREDQVPEDIRQRCPTACRLSSLLRTEIDESHLASFVSQNILVIPDVEAVKDLSSLANCPLCTRNGEFFDSTAKNVTAYDDELSNAGHQEQLNQYIAELQHEIQRLEREHKSVATQRDEAVAATTALEGNVQNASIALSYYENQCHSLRSQFIAARMKLDETSDALRAIHTVERGTFSKAIPLRETTTRKHRSLVKELKECLRRYDELSDSTDLRSEEARTLLNMDRKAEALNAKLEETRAVVLEHDSAIAQLVKEIEEHELKLAQLNQRHVQLDGEISAVEQKASSCEIELLKDEEALREAETAVECIPDRETYADDVESLRMAVAQAENELQPVIPKLQSLQALCESLQSKICESNKKASECDRIVGQIDGSGELESLHLRKSEELRALKNELNINEQENARAKSRFDELRALKSRNIETLLSRVAPLFDEIYGKLCYQTSHIAAKTYLKLVDDDNIDLGISLGAIPAGKPFQSLSSLSSGEFSAVLIALQTAIALAVDCNFLLIDEMDAWLDPFASRQLQYCLSQLCGATMQLKSMIITHQRRIYNVADEFIGMFKDGNATVVLVAPSQLEPAEPSTTGFTNMSSEDRALVCSPIELESGI